MCLIFQCLNEDGVIINLDVSYQYKAQPAKLHEIVMNFKDFDGYKTVLQYTGKYLCILPKYVGIANNQLFG